MRRVLKAIVWIVVFGAFAAAGAVVASRTDPFPPGVEDPGVRPSSSAEPTLGPRGSTLGVVVRASTAHELFVGGNCRSRWRIDVRVEVATSSVARGSGTATLAGAGCAFATAQVQADEVAIDLRGHVEEGTLIAVLRQDGAQPPGSTDLGGLVETLPRLRLAVPIDGPAQTAVVRIRDGERGRYVGRYVARATCEAGC